MLFNLPRWITEAKQRRFIELRRQRHPVRPTTRYSVVAHQTEMA
jgi:hypothetical protein